MTSSPVRGRLTVSARQLIIFMVKLITSLSGFKTRFLCVSASLLLSTGAGVAANADILGLVPLPRKVQIGEGVFRIQPPVRIVADADARDSGEYLAGRLRGATGCEVKVLAPASAPAGPGTIFLTAHSSQTNLTSEGYELTVNPQAINIQAPDSAGVFTVSKPCSS